MNENISYFPNLFSTNECDTYFNALKTKIDWQQSSIWMFGKLIAEPRLTAWYGDKSYRYSGKLMLPTAWNEDLMELKNTIETSAGAKFNSVLLNYYRSGTDSMGWHRDNEKELGPQPTIASVSFGAERMFEYREISNPFAKSRLVLENGSLLVMKNDFQNVYQHQVPKTKNLDLERINLTFRLIV